MNMNKLMTESLEQVGQTIGCVVKLFKRSDIDMDLFVSGKSKHFFLFEDIQIKINRTRQSKLAVEIPKNSLHEMMNLSCMWMRFEQCWGNVFDNVELAHGNGS